MARIEMQGLVKTYGSETVVDGIDLTIDDGELVVLLGPSGCGKTTTLRMVAGLEQITGGELRFDGEVVNHEPPDRRAVGMVFQNYALYPHMTVAGNLSFGLQSRRPRGSRRKARADERRRVQEIAELLEIDHVLDHRPKELSGGQRQRVALGRALIREPRVFLLDEPLSNLDASLRDRMRMELARLHERLPVTTVYVTHDQSEALTLADRVVVMHEGRIRQVAAPGDVYDRPADVFVAGFIGSPGMNLWPRAAAGDGDPFGDAAPGVELPRDAGGAPWSDGRAVTVGVRPEHLRLAGRHQDDLARVSCRVDVVENLGSHLLVHGSLPCGGGVVAHLQAGAGVVRDQDLVLGALPEHVHVFDTGTGERLGTVADRERIAVTV